MELRKAEHAFIEYDGVKYLDFNFIYVVDYQVCDSLPYGTNYVFGGAYANIFDDEEELNKLLDDTFVPANGSEIHVTPDCPIAAQDLRNNYKIKRLPDSGCCNVFHPTKRSAFGRAYTQMYVIFPDDKVIVAFEDESKHRNVFVNEAFDIANIPNHHKFINVYNTSRYTLFRTLSGKYEHYYKLLTKQYSKPCISYRKLEFKNVNQLTNDIIQIILQSGKSDYDASNLENFKTQLMMLNQHDYRNFPVTMNILFNDMLASSYHWRNVIHYKNSIPKPIKQIVEFTSQEHNEFGSKEDCDMAHQMIDSLMDIGDVKYPSYEALGKKIQEAGISEDTFNSLFNAIVKVTPKRYGE